MVSAPTRVLRVLLTVGPLLLAGCTAAPEADISPSDAEMAGVEPVADGPAGSPGPSWTETVSTGGQYLLAYGDPFDTLEGFLSACFLFTIPLPEGTTQLDLEVAPASPATAALFTFMARPEGGEWVGASAATLEGASLSMDAAPGEWEIWVWPDGPAVGAEFIVEAHITGGGEPPASVEVRAHCMDAAASYSFRVADVAERASDAR